jgi:hypothetical protein
MAKCANCAGDALYVYRITDTFEIVYCQYHLPRALGKKGATGVSLLPIEEAKIVEAVAPKATKKKSTPVVEEPAVVEEPTVEEAPAEETPIVEDAAPSGE